MTNDEREAIGAEGTVTALRRQRAGSGLMVKAFACCHCAEKLLPRYVSDHYQYMSLGDVRLHAKERFVYLCRHFRTRRLTWATSHGIEVANEGVDFFVDPLGSRGVLGGMNGDYCWVEVKPEATADASTDSNVHT